MLRTTDATVFNRIGNHPEVRPWIGVPAEIKEVDLSAMVSNPDNVCFTAEDESGGYILLKLAAGLYVAHTLAIPGGDGKAMRKVMREGFSVMFLATDAMEIVTTVPHGNERADRWAQIAGFRELWSRPAAFDLMGERVALSTRSLTYQEWALREPNNGELGKLVHMRIEQATGGLDHAEDRNHDRMLGAAVGCAIEGNVQKGVAMYNRWSSIAGYQPARLISVNPPLVNFGEGVIQLLSGRFDVLTTGAKPSLATASGEGAECRSELESPLLDQASPAAS